MNQSIRSLHRSFRRAVANAVICAVETLETRTFLSGSLASGGITARPPSTPINTKTPPPITLNVWPTYTQAVADLNTLHSTYPAITNLVNIGTTVQGRTIYAMEITDNPGVQEDEPEFYYQGQIHGDEPIGMENSFQMMSEMLGNYGGASATAIRETNLINNMDLWFVPSMNWDGYNASSPTVGHRGNANNVDLNRNFPEWTTRSFSSDTKLFGAYGNMYDGPTPTTTGLAVETIAMMNFLKSHHFVASANFHSGDLVTNYPWDTDGSTGANYATSPDDTLFKQMALVYSTQNTPMYNNNSSPFVHGTTNGDNWYPISGGEQDWANIYTGDHQFTIELDNVEKYPPASQLSTFWNNNRESMLQFMEAANWGIRGLVTDANSGAPLSAKVTVTTASSPTPDSHHPSSIPVFTDPTVGDYHRQLLPGNYTMKFEAVGYTQNINFTVSATTNDPTLTQRLNVQLLKPASATPNAPALWSSADSGSSQSDGVTKYNDGSPATRLTFDVSGTVSGATVGIYCDGTLIGSAVASSSLTSVTTTTAIVDGMHTITARQTESGKSQSADSTTSQITVDTAAPAITNPGNQGFEIVNTAGTSVNFAPAGANDALDPSPVVSYDHNPGSLFLPGATSVNVTATDAAGNVANGSFTVTLSDSPFIVRGGGAAYAFSGSVGSQTLTISAGQVSFVADANGYKSNLSVALMGSGTSLLINTTQHLAALLLGANTSGAVAAGGDKVLVTAGLSIDPLAKLDLNDNDMIVDYAATPASSTTLVTVAAAIRSARNSSAWNGNGITSTFAKNNPQGVTTLGAMESSDYKVLQHDPNAMFDGQVVDNSAVLVKYTYYGDTDFSGRVDGADYAHIDGAFSSQSTGAIGGWVNGDFDFSGRIDGSDYSFMDQGFLNQSGLL